MMDQRPSQRVCHAIMHENLRVTHHFSRVALPFRCEAAETCAVYDQNISLPTARHQEVGCCIKQPHGMADAREAHKQAKKWNRSACGLDGWCLGVRPASVRDGSHVPLSR